MAEALGTRIPESDVTGADVAGAETSALLADVRGSAGWIASQQRPDGSIPWYRGGPVDPWDHAEAAMALAVGGRTAEATAALDWLARTQRCDGSWPARRVRGRIVDGTGEAHAAVHLAVAVEHLLLATGGEIEPGRWWPALQRGVAYALGLALPSGAIRWARDPRGRAWPTALPTAASSTLLGLRSAVRLGSALGTPQPLWSAAADRLAGAIASGSGDVDRPGRHSMDWYWPVLAGAVPGAGGRARLAEAWGVFVQAGLGVRCVSDRPWFTAAETAEAAMACVVVGWPQRARRLLGDVAHLAHAPEPRQQAGGAGSWWTGWVAPAQARWPVERTTWTAAAVVLAVDALVDGSATQRLLTGGRSEGIA